jgi:hypothetical protein
MSRKEEFEGYKELVCERCGNDKWKLPLEGIMAKKQFAVCAKCGRQQNIEQDNTLETPK